MQCNHDCFHCTYPDCRDDTLSLVERSEQDAFDTSVRKDRLYGRGLVQWNYIHSEKGREAQKRYAQSEKGKANERRKRQRKIASGKNAEYCRAYYQRKKQLDMVRQTNSEGV